MEQSPRLVSGQCPMVNEVSAGEPLAAVRRRVTGPSHFSGKPRHKVLHLNSFPIRLHPLSTVSRPVWMGDEPSMRGRDVTAFPMVADMAAKPPPSSNEKKISSLGVRQFIGTGPPCFGASPAHRGFKGAAPEAHSAALAVEMESKPLSSRDFHSEEEYEWKIIPPPDPGYAFGRTTSRGSDNTSTLWICPEASYTRALIPEGISGQAVQSSRKAGVSPPPYPVQEESRIRAGGRTRALRK